MHFSEQINLNRNQRTPWIRNLNNYGLEPNEEFQDLQIMFLRR